MQMSSQRDRGQRGQDGRDDEQRRSVTDLPFDPGVDDAVADTDDSDMPKRPDRWLWIPTC